MDDRQERQAGAPRLEAVLFDMDGVITDTAEAHMAAWKQLFDAYLCARDPEAEPFTEADYRRYVDGKPRHDGVASFLASRDITLPFGDPADDPDQETICGLGNRKNRQFQRWLAAHPVHAFPGSLALLDEIRAAGLPAAVFSSSRNAAAVLESAGIQDRFVAKVDGEDMAAAGLPGKPDPAIMQLAADRLDITATGAAIVEDAIAGVEAGAAGGFAQVIGVDREGDGAALARAGADLVVADLAELAVGDGPRLVARTRQTAPLALAALGTLHQRLKGKRMAVFLDYDGTLAPIVEDPAAAIMGDGMRAALRHLAARVPVAIVSGRDFEDVRGLVQDDSLYYAGSHGFDLAGPGGWREVAEQSEPFLPALEAAGDALEELLAPIEAARVERKRFSLAVHFRQAPEADEKVVADAVRETIGQHPSLRASAGKKVFDVTPRVDWHKGRAVVMLLQKLDLERDDVLPIYVGDDTTDEDAFRALCHRGLGVVVRDGDDGRTAARLALEGTDEVERFLRWLTEEAAR